MSSESLSTRFSSQPTIVGERPTKPGKKQRRSTGCASAAGGIVRAVREFFVGRLGRRRPRPASRPEPPQMAPAPEDAVRNLTIRLGDRTSARIIVAVTAAAIEMIRKGDQHVASEAQPISASEISARKPLTTEFNGMKKPKIPLDLYLCHLVRCFNIFLKHETGFNSAGIRALLTATVYIERLCALNPGFALNSLNAHRVFLAAMLLAIKTAEDDHPWNSHVARVGGVDLEQLNHLELLFCNGLGFSLAISLSELAEASVHYDPEHSHDIIAPQSSSENLISEHKP